jgi:hypothetical protein
MTRATAPTGAPVTITSASAVGDRRCESIEFVGHEGGS